MRIVNVLVWQPYNEILQLGIRGENEATEIRFNIASLIREYGEGTVVVMARRFEDASAYPVVANRDGKIVTWVVSDIDTAIAGSGKCELFYYVGSTLAKTVSYDTVVEDDIGEAVDEAPDAIGTWVDTLTALGVETLRNADQAAQSAADAEAAAEHYPKIIDGYWYVWDVNEDDFVSTDIYAQGDKGDPGEKGDPREKGDTGVSVESVVVNDDYSLTVTLTDGSEYTSVSLRGPQGEQGVKGDPGTKGDPGEKGDAYELTPEDKQEIADVIFSELPTVPVHHYGARWNKTTAQLERTGSAVTITTDTSIFCHRGYVNEGLYNPFDNIYPWAGCKLCNIDIDLYMTMSAGADITECVIAWEGDPDFSYSHENGVWKYRPEFWGKSWDEDGYRYFDITDKAIGGYIHYAPTIRGRWHGVRESRNIDGATKDILLPKLGVPCSGVTAATLHQYAGNYDATLDSVFSLDGSILMFIIEYATMNAQSAIGDGVVNLYRQNSDDKFLHSTSDDNVVYVSAGAYDDIIPGAIMDIGTINGGSQVGRYKVVSVRYGGVGNTELVVTLDRAVTVSVSNYWSIHGLANVADEAIGSDSGYIGTNGRCNCYYRGEVLWGNMFYYVLGAYHEADTNHIWFARSDAAADQYDGIDTSAHLDSGIAIASTAGYIYSLAYPGSAYGVASPSLCSFTAGGSSANPVGDTVTVNTRANTVLFVGGHSFSVSAAGPFSWSWGYDGNYFGPMYAGCPRLKCP